jgi:hypothetical protein
MGRAAGARRRASATSVHPGEPWGRGGSRDAGVKRAFSQRGACGHVGVAHAT